MTAIFLSACGGGSGGNTVRPQAPPPPTCEDPLAENTGAPLPCTYPPVCEDPLAENTGGALPCIYRYRGPKDNLLVPNNADLAHAQKLTGTGVTVGMVDVAFDFAAMDYSPLDGKVLSYDTTLESFEFIEDVRDSDKLHFQFTAAHLAARPTASSNGGIAPDAQLRWFGVCTTAHEDCVYDPEKSSHYLHTLLEYGDIRLINASLGGNEEGLIIDDTSYWAGSYWEPLLEHDALIVGSAGNNNQAQPADLWQVPHINPEYYGHMITTIALHAGRDTDPWGGGENVSDDPRYEVYRAEYSNACGIAAQWCVGAVTNARIPDFDNPDVLSWGGGTSGAAPTVTGVAALVMQAYPWMSAPNIQQTLLTTATDLGEPGVDPVYGWGLVNARKAIDGPAQFVRNPLIDGFSADIEGESRPFFNDISGQGGFWKKGSGSLTMTGHNTYTGGTVIEGGTLRVTGSLGSDVTVHPAAMFMTGGTGATINGDYLALHAEDWNDGVPQLGLNTGAAITAIQIGAPLTVTGKADIADSRLLLLPEAERYTVQSTEMLITTGKGLVGTFAQVDYGSGFFWTARLDYAEFNLSADLTRVSAKAKAMSISAPQQVIDGASAADALIAHTHTVVNSGHMAGNEALIAATAQLLASPDDKVAARSLSSLGGTIHSAARALGVQRSLDAGEQLSGRLRSVSTSSTGMWLQSDSSARQFTRMGERDTEMHHSHFGFGADTRVGNTWTLGVSASQTRSSAHLDTLGGRLAGQGQQMGIYARRDLRGKGYLSGLVSHDRHSVTTQRRVLTGNTLTHASGQHTDLSALLRLETGLSLQGGLTHYLAAGTLSLRQGGFTESGTLGLSADTDTFNARFIDVGSRFERHIKHWRIGSTLSARRMWGADRGFSAAFAGAKSAQFNLSGSPLNRSHIRFGADADYQAKNGYRLSLGLNADHGAHQRTQIWSEFSVNMAF